jgi:ribosome maturation factor RimP
VSDALEALVTTELDLLEFDLVEFRRRGSRARPVLEVRIERRDGAALAVDDCARVSGRWRPGSTSSRSRAIDTSSRCRRPESSGPLRTPGEWRRFVGQSAVVTAAPLSGGKAEVEIVGVEGEVGAEVAVVRDERGAEHRLPMSAITQARLAFHWKK